jgi:hypothetical protein
MKKMMFILLMPVIFSNCKKSSTPPQQTVVQQLVGNWTTPNPVTFYYSSNGCGTFTRYSSFPIKLNWQITANGENWINVTWTLVSGGNQTQIGNDCGWPSPLITLPQYFIGVVTGNDFSMDQNQTLQGVFHYSNGVITGTMNEKQCQLYCGGYSTDQNAFILTRVN